MIRIPDLFQISVAVVGVFRDRAVGVDGLVQVAAGAVSI
jgi:hypothetical protein